MEKYVSRYKVEEGINFQVRDRGICNRGIDFLVNGEFLEWHPIVLYAGIRGDIPAKEIQAYREGLEFLPEEEKAEFRTEYAQFLARRYLASRQQAVASSEYAGKEVSLATNIQELYSFIKRYNPNLPDLADCAREFREKCKYLRQFKVKKKNT